MEISAEVISGLQLVNSGVIEKEFIEQILEHVESSLISSNRSNSDLEGETAIIHNTLTFAISSLLLDTSKYGVSIEALSKTLQNNGLDIKTDLFRLVIDFIAENLPKVTENLQRTELNPDPRFRSLSWSQKVDIKSSNIDNIRERSFVLDFSHRLPAQGEDEHFELEVSAKELVDLHSGLRDCLRNIERLINKTNN